MDLRIYETVLIIWKEIIMIAYVKILPLLKMVKIKAGRGLFREKVFAVIFFIKSRHKRPLWQQHMKQQ